MRISIFSHGSNPATDKPLLRKKLHYIQSLIAERNAFPINPANIYAGVQLRGRVLTKDGDIISRVAGAGFDTAWHIKQSGWDGPLVWQLRTMRA